MKFLWLPFLFNHIQGRQRFINPQLLAFHKGIQLWVCDRLPSSYKPHIKHINTCSRRSNHYYRHEYKQASFRLFWCVNASQPSLMKCSGFSAAMTIKEKLQLKKKMVLFMRHVARSTVQSWGCRSSWTSTCIINANEHATARLYLAWFDTMARLYLAWSPVWIGARRRPAPSRWNFPTILPIQAVTSLGNTGEVTSFGRAPVNALASLINNHAAYFCLWLFFIVRLLRWQVLCQKATKLLHFMGYITTLNPVWITVKHNWIGFDIGHRGGIVIHSHKDDYKWDNSFILYINDKSYELKSS